MVWRLSALRTLTLDRPRVLAIVNTTPDSFHAPSRLTDPSFAGEALARLVEEGADALDLGAESTRPGSVSVPPDQQIARLLPVLRAARAARTPALAGIPITVDTTSAAVARAALDAGADAINDVSAGLDDPGMLPLAASAGAGLILMHRLTQPALDRYADQYEQAPAYRDVVVEVGGFLAERALAAERAGIGREALVLDPGLGFGKSVEQNLALLRGTPALLARGFPVLSALSRKSFVGRVSLGRDSQTQERLEGTIALSVLHLSLGARLFRVHDPAPLARALRAAWELLAPGQTPVSGPGQPLSPPEAGGIENA